MTIEKAIAEAKENNYWISDKPTSVNVGFYNYADERDDETQFDLWNDHEEELIDLWHDQWVEMKSKLTGVLYVEALGYVEG